MDVSASVAARLFGAAYFNLIRRGADGSLVLSADRWRLVRLTEETFDFEAQATEAPPTVVERGDVERISWDRLPKQQRRSQVRFQLRSGDVWTFSGVCDESALPK
jgi:hypothetical protein